MIKVISFSLWGTNPTYNVGAIRNAQDAKIMYPDFECWFYIHKESVSIDTINELEKLNNTKIIFKCGDLNLIKPMMWRFEAIDDENVSIMLSRDTDTRFLLREKLAVYEWLNSNTLFHIMRDHPQHSTYILGGMFGTRKIPGICKWINIMKPYIQNGDRDYDQNFLSKFIYPLIVNNSTIHASFHKFESHSKNFPKEYENDLRFVGEYVYHDESRNQQNIDELKNLLN